MLPRLGFYWCVLPFVSLSSGFNHFGNPFSFEIDQCKDICADSFFLLPPDEDSQTVCQRGCRFFNIIDTTEERDVNETSKECYLSCAESYMNTAAKGSCTTGCDTMSKKKQSDLQKFFPYLEQYSSDDQEMESLETDILLDPLIKKQLKAGYDLQYKIPEAYIRTMPIDSDGITVADSTRRSFEYKHHIICSNIIPVAVFIIILIGLVLCILKIVQLVQAIHHNRELSVRAAEDDCCASDCNLHGSLEKSDLLDVFDDKKLLI